MAALHVNCERTIYRGREYILYSSSIYSDGLIYVKIRDGTPLGKCIGCLYDGIGDEYGEYAWNFKYVFSLNGRETIYATCELFDNHKAIVLVENTSKKDVCIKTESNNEQKIQQHHIFSIYDIIIKLLVGSLPTLSIKDDYITSFPTLSVEDNIDIIKMIVTFGRVNRLCYKASLEIKAKVSREINAKVSQEINAKVMSSLKAFDPSRHGIEIFYNKLNVGELYVSVIADRVMYQYGQRRYFGNKSTLRYVGKFISMQICRSNNARNNEYTYTFQKGDENIIIRLGDNDRSYFNHVGECNIDDDPCEIICIHNNKKQSDEFCEREHLKHQYKILINKYLNIMIDKNVNKHEVNEAKNKAIEFVKKLWNVNQLYQFTKLKN